MCALCGSSYEDFNIQMRRKVVNDQPTITNITMKLNDTVVELTKNSVRVDGSLMTLPFSHSGVLIDKSSSYIKVTAKLGLVAKWNEDDSFTVELDMMYQNKTCGLCGDFNGIQLHNEFIKKDVDRSIYDYGHFVKMDSSTESCMKQISSTKACKKMTSVCEQLLSGPSFNSCKDLIPLDSFIKACELDMCYCTKRTRSFCFCRTISEYSHQCRQAGGKPDSWRTEQFCGKSCSYHNMVHQECGNPCINTCSNPDRGYICEDHCFNGCFCPAGYLFDDLTGRGCIAKNKCPCIHNGKTYKPGQTYRSNCKECTCKDSKWQCTTDLCHGTCTVYGDGHYITFDGKRYTFDGDCEYTLIRDYCGHANASGTFRVLTENIPCGTTGTTCSKAVRVFLGNKEFKLTDGSYQILHRDEGVDIPYQIWKRGIYMVIEANNGLIVMWDQRTNMFIKLSPNFKGSVCGLCGNYDGNANNDFMLRSQKVVIKPLDFGNDWKESSSCPVAMEIKNPCSNNPYRELWAQKECSIIKSQVFTTCHSQVDPSHFYDACVRDSCACDSGGDRDCLCAAIAAYAQACNEAGTCVAWRTPKICPMFCDYYNPSDECEWHYKPCGAPCMQTCRNPTGQCSSQILALEGCYPKCPPGHPYFDEDTMKCVKSEQCGCYDKQGERYHNQEIVPSEENCQICYCDFMEIKCKYNSTACTCTFRGKKYLYGDTIYNTTDGLGSCMTAVCKEHGIIQKASYTCQTSHPTTTYIPTTVFDFSSKTTGSSRGHITARQDCVCEIYGNTFKPESEIYNKTDGDGWCYIAKCVKTEEKKCDVIKLSQPCLTTVLPSGHKCDKYMPPLTDGESIHVGNCYIGTCINGTIEHKPVHCDPVEYPVCENKFSPLKVADKYGCCFKYECQCVCSGFFNLHYITFDGTYYPFQGNSSYVLVQEKDTKYNFSVVVDNICDFEDGLSCPKALKVHYKSSEIIMTQRTSGGIAMNLIYVNHKKVKLPFQMIDVRATENDKESLVVISEIGAQISFTGTMFSINLPWQKFHGNTEGHCGVCDNNQTNDCRLPNGTIISSCQDMAPYWNVHNNNNNNLLSSRHESTSVPCPSSAICKIIEHKLFKKCHKFIPPEPYVSACNIDVCNMNNETVGCATLQAYAKKCAMVGVCVDWRDATNGVCDFKCKMPQIYVACGPQVEPACNGRFNLKYLHGSNEFSNLKSMLREGCYCPSGTTLLQHNSNICVPSCGYKDYQKNGVAI